MQLLPLISSLLIRRWPLSGSSKGVNFKDSIPKKLTEMIQSTTATGLNINKNNTKLRHYLLKLWVEGTINNCVQIIIGISCMTLKY